MIMAFVNRGFVIVMRVIRAMTVLSVYVQNFVMEEATVIPKQESVHVILDSSSLTALEFNAPTYAGIKVSV